MNNVPFHVHALLPALFNKISCRVKKVSNIGVPLEKRGYVHPPLDCAGSQGLTQSLSSVMVTVILLMPWTSLKDLTKWKDYINHVQEKRRMALGQLVAEAQNWTLSKHGRLTVDLSTKLSIRYGRAPWSHVGDVISVMATCHHSDRDRSAPWPFIVLNWWSYVSTMALKWRP